MSHTEKSINPKAALVVSAVILAIAISVLVTAYGFHGGSGLFPRFVGWIFVGLAGAEFLLQLKLMLRAAKPAETDASDKASSRANLIKEVKGVLWMGSFVVGVYLAGFLITIPVYLFTFMRFSGHRSIKESAGLAIGSTAFIWLLFTELLDYKLFPGILFGA